MEKTQIIVSHRLLISTCFSSKVNNLNEIKYSRQGCRIRLHDLYYKLKYLQKSPVSDIIGLYCIINKIENQRKNYLKKCE